MTGVLHWADGRTESMAEHFVGGVRFTKTWTVRDLGEDGRMLAAFETTFEVRTTEFGGGTPEAWHYYEVGTKQIR